MILEKIRDPEDIKRLNASQVDQLCRELRAFLIQKVAHTGGHLASNLGVVELTVAIHRVFDTSRDRLVFDVGHQCYTHKILTGRQSLFHTLRQLGGLSGFPKPYESEHDAFVAGHASNSVSVALGMAHARTLLHEDYSVLALIGDGAMTGGLSFEGLNDAGASGEPIIVILNDNGMSIEANVGGLSRHLSRLRSEEGYNNFKKWYKEKLQGDSPTKKNLYKASSQVKHWLKSTLLPESTMFEKMGFSYMGPVDGHNVQKLTQILTWAREKNEPVLLHVLTEKGKGYPFAQQDPERFHGTPPFDPVTGRSLQAQEECFSDVFGEALLNLARQDNRICAITAAMTSGTGLTEFSKEFPHRFFDVGIAEGHAVAMAGGMAKQGLIPVFAVYSSFLQRGFDMLIHDISLDNLHAVFCVDRAGLVGADGRTHHGCFDTAYLSAIPGMTVLCPASFAELKDMLRYAVYEVTGPVAIRYSRGGQKGYQISNAPAYYSQLREGYDFTILTYGMLINEALKASELLAQKGISIQVLKLNRIAPLNESEVDQMLKKTKRLLVLEDCIAVGCVGEKVACLATQAGVKLDKLILKNCGARLPDEGSVDQLNQALGLDAVSVAASIEEALHEQ